MHKEYIPDEFKQFIKFAFEQARNNRERYFSEIKSYIEQAISLINGFDKVYILGGLAARHLCSTTMLNDVLISDVKHSDDNGIIREKVNDTDAEVILEYAMSIATATPNINEDIIPTQEQIDSIYQLLNKIKFNIAFFYESEDIQIDSNYYNSWLRTNMMTYTMSVRGNAEYVHLKEIFLELFQLHDPLLESKYGISSSEILEVLEKLETLVYSKIGDEEGMEAIWHRFKDWIETKGDANITKEWAEGTYAIVQFGNDNPDVTIDQNDNRIILHAINSIDAYPKIFWVLPKTHKEEIIFNLLSLDFGDNENYFLPEKYKAFPLGESLIQTKPLIRSRNKYYYFSSTVAFRNLFKIVEDLIKNSDEQYFNKVYKGNLHIKSRNTYFELKTKYLFQRILPEVTFYHSVEYETVREGVVELDQMDILGIGVESIYCIEVKAGELNLKHRRGATKGLKERLREIVNEASYQTNRAERFILSTARAEFYYHDAQKKQKLSVSESQKRHIYKISVSVEELGPLGINLHYLREAGILDYGHTWSWFISIYDLMIFSDAIQSEDIFVNYLNNRYSLYERNDLYFQDEIDILGCFLSGQLFDLIEDRNTNENKLIHGFKDKIDEYYRKRTFELIEHDLSFSEYFKNN